MNTVEIDAVVLREQISNTILNMKKPFKLSQLYSKLKENGIFDEYLTLDVLNQLYESGLVERTDIENDVSEYTSNF
nr:MAG TPA: ferric uptake regulation protein [Caudoviricetes sp.]